MMQEDFDKMMRQAVPPVTITDNRLEHFIDAVLDKAAQEPRTRAKKRGWSWNWPVLAPVLRYAVPMAVALVMAFSVGESNAQEAPLSQFSSFYLSATLVPAGS